MSQIDPSVLRVLAEAQGFEDLDGEFLARVAHGAANAISAVRRTLSGSLFDTDPALFLPTLEALAARERE